MMRGLSGWIVGWRLQQVLFCAPLLFSCGGTQEFESEPPPTLESPQDPKPPEELAGGQSGSEGGDAATPCLSDQYPLFAGVVTAVEGGCATVSDVEVLIGAGVLSSEDEGTSLRGIYRPHFTFDAIEVGQTVYAVYRPDPLGNGSGSFELAIVEEGVVLLTWRGISYESSLEELLSEGCKDLFLERPYGEASPDPDVEIPTPLSCEEAP